jgi:hypothetical protein
MTTLSCEVQETVELCCEEGTEAENEENNEEEQEASFPACSKVMQYLDRYHYFSVTQVPETIIKSLFELETIQQICLEKVQQTNNDRTCRIYVQYILSLGFF